MLNEVTIPFAAHDGFPLNLVHVKGDKPPTRGPLILVHGAGVRANLFRPPIEHNLVTTLINAGYDVWLENWRASIDVPKNIWTLDQAALYDHPAAVRKVLAETGASTMKALIHCQGSTSFAMSAVAGLVPQVETIISNAVSLHPVVPGWSRWKLRFAVPLVRRMTDYLDCQWAVKTNDWPAWLIHSMVRLTHHECNNGVCKMVSFTYGSGFPALWKHEQLDEVTHDWLRREFAQVPLRFFQQMARCVKAGHLMRYDDLPALPADFVAEPPKTNARFAFFAGEQSGCFLPESQVRSHEYLSRYGKNHTLHVIPNYSHLDVLIGKNASKDVFPLILEELAR